VDQRVSIVTLAVTDLGRATEFYAALGWRGQEVEETVFFQAGGLVVVLWGRDELAADSGVVDHGPVPFGGVVLAHNVRSRAEVDEVVAEAERAGATVTRAPAATFYGGYAAVFADPDGHLWEIAHNPAFTLHDDGSLELPDFAAPTSPSGTGG
jgi:predicted lactoylglutathione lyase